MPQRRWRWLLSRWWSPSHSLVPELARPLYRQFRDAWTQLRLHWLEGRIARGLGHLSEAEAIFLQLSGDLAASENHYDLTLVSIDLAMVYASQGKWDACARLVADFFPLLESWGIHREALAAWTLLHQALAKGQVQTEVFKHLGLYFRQAWHRPAEFQSPGGRPLEG